MKLDAVGVTTSDMKKTVEFYTLLGFDFSGVNIDDDHVEPATPGGSARLMIDEVSIVKDIIGEDPEPSNHSHFAVQYDSPEEVNDICEKLKEKGFKVAKEPWDAFLGQRYAIVEDPGGYKLDLYAYLNK